MDTGPSAPTAAPPSAGEAEAFYRELERRHLVALWNVAATLLPKEPKSRALPYLWRWETLLPTVRDLLNSFSRICCLSLTMIFAAVPAIGRSPASQSRDQARYAISSFRATPFSRCGTRRRESVSVKAGR